MSRDHNMGCAAQLIKDAQEALNRLHRTNLLADWFVYGKAISALRVDAMRIAKTNKPKGRKYSISMSTLLKEAGLDGVHKTTRSRLTNVMENREAIEAWLAEVPPQKRLRLNHPEPVLSAWKRHIAGPTEKPKSEPIPELVGIWKNATIEDRRAALDGGGLDLLLEALSPVLRARIEQQLANPHTGHRLTEKRELEEAAVNVALENIKERCPKLGNVPAYGENSVKAKRKRVKLKPPKNIGVWRKVSRERLEKIYGHERQRMEAEHLNVRELKRLEKIRERLDAMEKTDTANARQGNGGDPMETAKARMADNAKRFEEEPAVVA
jgi:hypothetical protein